MLDIPSGAASAQDVPPATASCAGRIVSTIVVPPRAPAFDHAAFGGPIRPEWYGAEPGGGR